MSVSAAVDWSACIVGAGAEMTCAPGLVLAGPLYKMKMPARRRVRRRVASIVVLLTAGPPRPSARAVSLSSPHMSSAGITKLSVAARLLRSPARLLSTHWGLGATTVPGGRGARVATEGQMERRLRRMPSVPVMPHSPCQLRTYTRTHAGLPATSRAELSGMRSAGSARCRSARAYWMPWLTSIPTMNSSPDSSVSSVQPRMSISR